MLLLQKMMLRSDFFQTDPDPAPIHPSGSRSESDSSSDSINDYFELFPQALSDRICLFDICVSLT